MQLADRPQNWLPLNAGNRWFALFLLNGSGWAISLAVFWAAASATLRREDRLKD
jgi:hypothetical protein